MQQPVISKIIKKLPADFSKHCARDISLLSCSIFGESHRRAKRIFGVSFSATLWVTRNNLVNFYRSKGEYLEFSGKVGKLCKNTKYSKWLTQKLIEMTDWFDNFLKQNNKLEDLVKNNKIFFDNYRDFFVYHQAVNWGGDYLSQLCSGKKFDRKQRIKINLIIKNLDLAYKYNEMVVPNLEKYFKKLQIDNLLYDEVNKNVYKNIKQKPRNRSLVFIKNKRFVLSGGKARLIENFIERKSKRDYGKLGKFKGLAVSGGIFTGRVRRILNLDRLKECQKDDVLVTTMTRPQFNRFIRKAGAIITDEGGILCHASILAREFKIPCVIGTKIATKVLKDGDLVEVDAEEGIVKILKKK